MVKTALSLIRFKQFALRPGGFGSAFLLRISRQELCLAEKFDFLYAKTVIQVVILLVIVAIETRWADGHAGRSLKIGDRAPYKIVDAIRPGYSARLFSPGCRRSAY